MKAVWFGLNWTPVKTTIHQYHNWHATSSLFIAARSTSETQPSVLLCENQLRGELWNSAHLNTANMTVLLKSLKTLCSLDNYWRREHISLSTSFHDKPFLQNQIEQISTMDNLIIIKDCCTMENIHKGIHNVFISFVVINNLNSCTILKGKFTLNEHIYFIQSSM